MCVEGHSLKGWSAASITLCGWARVRVRVELRVRMELRVRVKLAADVRSSTERGALPHPHPASIAGLKPRLCSRWCLTMVRACSSGGVLGGGAGDPRERKKRVKSSPAE